MHSPLRAESGFTLIELMIALVLGLLTVLIIAQVLTLSEGQSRTISAGSSAQVNGRLASFTLQREIRQAGYSVASNPQALGCPVKAKNGGTAFDFVLAPVVIAAGGPDAPDSVTILRGNPALAGVPVPLAENHTAEDIEFVVESSLGIRQNDQFIVAPPDDTWETDPAKWWCVLLTATSDAANPLVTNRVPHKGAGFNQESPWPDDEYLGSASAANPRSYLLNLGRQIQRTYSISDAGNLRVSERQENGSMSDAEDLFSQVVSLKALYGKDTNADGSVDRYDTTTPVDNAAWRQVLTIRVAVVARSTQYEKEIVTADDPLWDVGSAETLADVTVEDCNGESKCIRLPIAQLSDWKHYRYKIYDTIVPLRNMIWNTEQRL